MSIIDKNLARTAYSGINYDNIIRDVITIIQNDPDFSFNMEDFTSSNAGRMILELYAYIGDQLATRLDWYINEGYLPTAKQRDSVIKILKLIGYKLGLPISSSVDVSLTPKSNLVGVSTLTKYIPTVSSPSFYPFSLSAKGLDGNTLNFEAIKFNSYTQEFDYKEDIVYENGVDSLTFWEGTTIVEDFIVETTNNQIFYLTHSDVTKNSVQAYRVVLADDGETPIEEKLVYVDSFLEKKAQRFKTDEEKKEIPYTLNIEDRRASIEFAPISLVPRASKRPSLGDRIRVFYRVGGGENTNIVKRAINTTIPVESNNGDIVQINFTNLKAATGGENEESNEHAKEYAPLTIRAQERTVNEEDYITIGKGYDKVYKIKSYGVKNLDADTVYDRYGEYIKPLEVWNYVLCKNNGYQDLKDNEFKDFRWITKRFENRFNEEYGFSKGKFNYKIGTPTIINYSNENDFKNYITFFVEADNYIKAKLAKKENSPDTEHFSDVENIFGDDYISYGSEEITSIEKGFNPQRTSVDLTSYQPVGKHIRFDVDNNSYDVALEAEDTTNNKSFLEVNCDKINSIATAKNSAIFVFTSVQNPKQENTNIDTQDGTSLVFSVKVNDIEKVISVDIGDTFESDFKTAISDAFDLSPERIDVTILAPASDTEDSVYTTTITVGNQGYNPENYVHFFEITSYPDVLEKTSDKIYGGGDYSNIASIVNDKYIKIKSPNTGKNANIVFIENGENQTVEYCTKKFFGIDSFKENKTIYGNRRLVFIPGVNQFIFENGFFDFNLEKDGDEILNDANFFLNYLTSESDEIIFGNYGTTFSKESPKYREPATRIYNTIYNDFDIDYKNSYPIVKIAKNPQNIISLYQRDINEFTYGDNKKLTLTDSPHVEINLSGVLGGSNMKIGIDIPGVSYKNTKNDNISIFESSNGDENNNFIEIAAEINEPTNFVKIINRNLRELYKSTRLPIFGTFTFATYNENNNTLIIYTPTRNIDSNVCCQYVKTDSSIETEIETVNNDYCLTHKYKPVKYIEVSGVTIKANKDNIKEEIKVGDFLIYSSEKTLQVVNVQEQTQGQDQEKVTIVTITLKTDVESINWDNAPEILYFTDDFIYMQKISNNFPDLIFYANYIADKRFIDKVYEKYSGELEEDEVRDYLEKYKILALENVFKEPIINTFDISGTVYYNQRLYTEEFVKKNVEEALYEAFSLDNSEFGESIKKSKVLSVVQNLTCVEWVGLNYIRRSYNYDTDSNTDDNEIFCNFDEILILSDNYREEDNGYKHGILFKYTSEN